MKERIDKRLGLVLGRQIIEFWHYYLAAVVALIFTNVTQSYLPIYAKDLADSIESGVGTVPIWHFFILALAILVFRTLSRLLFFYPARIFQRNLRIELIQKLESCFPARYHSYPAGQLFQIIYDDLDHFRNLVGFVLLQVGNIVIASAVLLPRIVGLHLSLIWALLPMIVGLIVFSYIASKNTERYKKMQGYQGDVQNYIMETYEGKKTIKNYSAESSFISLFKKYSNRELDEFYIAGQRVSTTRPIIPLGMGLSLLWGAHICHANDLGATTLIAFSGFTFLFLEPLMFLSWISVVLSRSLGAWARISELSETLNETSFVEDRIRDRKTQDGVVKLDLWDEEINLELVPGDLRVVVGKTGHGKSHILKQLAFHLRLHGDVVSYVSQTPYLYNDTVYNNIFLGRTVSKDQEDYAFKLLDLFALSFLASGRDELFNLEVGENGTRLSGGQSKRLALVRSLLSKSSYIIWDDPFSSVDVILEKEIMGHLKETDLFKDKVVFFSSHRVSTVEMCDYIYYIEKETGVVEKGERSALLERNMKTYEYFKSQMV